MTPASPLPSLTDAYRAGHLTEFFAHTPADLTAVLNAGRELDRPALVAALRAYHTDLGLPDAAAKEGRQRRQNAQRPA